jgi:hypothetical protein
MKPPSLAKISFCNFAARPRLRRGSPRTLTISSFFLPCSENKVSATRVPPPPNFVPVKMGVALNILSIMEKYTLDYISGKPQCLALGSSKALDNRKVINYYINKR